MTKVRLYVGLKVPDATAITAFSTFITHPGTLKNFILPLWLTTFLYAIVNTDRPA